MSRALSVLTLLFWAALTIRSVFPDDERGIADESASPAWTLLASTFLNSNAADNVVDTMGTVPSVLRFARSVSSVAALISL